MDTLAAERPSDQRTIPFKDRPSNRYWWFRVTQAGYVPPVFQELDPSEWAIMRDWYEDTDAKYSAGTGECNVSAICFLHGLIGGSNIRRVVQLGHYIGFSSLLMGFQLRRMGPAHKLVSFDIDPKCTAYTRDWLERAQLSDRVKLVLMDSASEGAPAIAETYLDGAPELLFIDSSHQYAHTIAELDRWYERMAPGGVIVMHDTSEFAARFDSSGAGGVLKALRDWSARTGAPYFALNQSVTGAPGEPPPVYRDGCGLGIVQKPLMSA